MAEVVRVDLEDSVYSFRKPSRQLVVELVLPTLCSIGGEGFGLGSGLGVNGLGSGLGVNQGADTPGCAS